MEERNQRPEEGSKLPTVALGVLVFIIFALLYVGYEYASDNTSSTTELTNVKLDTTMMARMDEEIQPTEPPKKKTGKRAEYVPPADLPTDNEAINSEAGAKDDAVPPTLPKMVEPAKAPKKEETPKPEPVKEVKPPVAKVEDAPKKEAKKPETKAVIPAGGTVITHSVGGGQTVYNIATRYNMKVETLKEMNPSLEGNNVKSGVTKLKVRVRAVHTVGAGDILRVVAQKYGITVEQLMAANGKTKNFAQRGERLVIPYPTKQ